MHFMLWKTYKGWQRGYLHHLSEICAISWFQVHVITDLICSVHYIIDICLTLIITKNCSFEIYAEASDDTGSIIVILEDREVRNLLQTTALELIANVKY